MSGQLWLRNLADMISNIRSRFRAGAGRIWISDSQAQSCQVTGNRRRLPERLLANWFIISMLVARLGIDYSVYSGSPTISGVRLQFEKRFVLPPIITSTHRS